MKFAWSVVGNLANWGSTVLQPSLNFESPSKVKISAVGFLHTPRQLGTRKSGRDEAWLKGKIRATRTDWTGEFLNNKGGLWVPGYSAWDCPKVDLRTKNDLRLGNSAPLRQRTHLGGSFLLAPIMVH